MAEITDPAGTSSSHVVIDLDEAAAEDDDSTAAATSSCAVCMEPMEWVAVSPCGHGEVCVRCAARIRFVHNDRRCCICRSHCATVVVTRADRATTTQRERPFLSPPPPPPAPALGGQGLAVGVDYWYHRGMGAYFDDLSQYQEMSKVCTAAAPLSSEGSGGAGAARQADHAASPVELEPPLSRQDKAVLVLLGVAGVFVVGSPLLYMIQT